MTVFFMNITYRKRMMNMFWYLVCDKSNVSAALVDFFNQQSDSYAFIPKIERWHSKKAYQIQDLYPGYVFIKSHLDEQHFTRQYRTFFESIEHAAYLIKQGDRYSLSRDMQDIYDRILDQDIVRHSTGNIVDTKLIVDQGPLKGLEDDIIKINRHKRFALLKHDALHIKVPLEVISKNGG